MSVDPGDSASQGGTCYDYHLGLSRTHLKTNGQTNLSYSTSSVTLTCYKIISDIFTFLEEYSSLKFNVYFILIAS